MSTAPSRKNSPLVNIGVFGCVFCVVSYCMASPSGAADRGWFSLFNPFGKRRSVGEQTLHYARETFNDPLGVIIRIYLASFLKDALISTLSPKMLKTAIPRELIKQVEGGTLNDNWIPEPRRSASGEPMNGSPEPGTRRTSVYIIGRGAIDFAVKLCDMITSVFLRLVVGIQWTLAYGSNGIVGVVLFTIRSVCCAVSSSALVALHLVQIVLRTIRLIYNVVEVLLARACQIVNDCSLLSVDVIRASAVKRGEKTFTKLADRGPFGPGDGQK